MRNDYLMAIDADSGSCMHLTRIVPILHLYGVDFGVYRIELRRGALFVSESFVVLGASNRNLDVTSI